MALGGEPDAFWRQTPRSYIVCMEGMVRAANRNVDLAYVVAWHTAIFGLSGYAGKLKGKSLSDFLPSARDNGDQSRLSHAQAIAFFHRLKARGFDVEISTTRVVSQFENN